MIPGLVLVLIGVAFLLGNFGYIHFHWGSIWPILLPLLLLIGGVNLLFSGSRSALATIVKITVVMAAFGLLLFANTTDRYHWWWWPHHYHYYSDNGDDDDDNTSADNGNDHSKLVQVSGSSQFNQPYDAAIKVARLNISGGATTFRLQDTTSQLFKADTKSFHGRFEFNGHSEDSVYVMNFDMKENHGIWNWGDNNDNSAFISLNTNPVWELHIDAGATDLNFDLSRYKMRDVVLKGGAANFVLKMGQPLDQTNIDVSTGASDVTINIPQDAACHIKTDSGLSSTTFDGFSKMDDGNYQTAGFDTARNKMYIHISGGVSDFKVHKY